MSQFLPMSFNGVIVVEDEHVPLTSRDPKTGEVRDLLCFKIDGRLHFHPRGSRWSHGSSRDSIETPSSTDGQMTEEQIRATESG